jgi:hypothetical protein
VFIDRVKYNTLSVLGEVVTAWFIIIIGIPIRNNTLICWL